MALETQAIACPAKMKAQEAHQLILEGRAVLVDVRGYDEFAAGHAHGAKCIPLSELESRIGETGEGKIVCVICASGNRSAMAAERLRALGMQRVIDVEGGFGAWDRAGLPVLKQKGVIPLERQVRGIAGFLVFGFALAGAFANAAFLYGAAFVGFMLFLSGVTGLCPMLLLLKKMPWNRVAAESANNGSCKAS